MLKDADAYKFALDALNEMGLTNVLGVALPDTRISLAAAVCRVGAAIALLQRKDVHIQDVHIHLPLRPHGAVQLSPPLLDERKDVLVALRVSTFITLSTSS